MIDRRWLVVGAGATSALLIGSAAFAMVDGTDAGPAASAVGRVVVSDQAGLPVRGCTGTLVDRQWMVTAAQCVTAGRPIDATIAGSTVAVTGVVAHSTRDVALVKLATPVTTIIPAALGGAAPATAESLTVVGFGRTATEWVPDNAHQKQVTVASSTGSTVTLTGAALCQGDAGAPILRTSGTTPQVLGLAVASGRAGCLGATDTTAADITAARTDDLGAWLIQSISGPATFTGMAKAAAGRLTPDTNDDVIAVETATGKLWLYPGTAVGGILDRRVTIGTGGWNGIGQLAAGDLTGDGLADVVAVETSTGKLFLYPNTGQSTLGTRVEISSGGWNGMAYLISADFTGDNRADVVAAEVSTGKLFLYPNTGQSTLGTRVAIGSGGWNGFTRLVAGDLTGDNRPDVVGVETSTGKLFLYPHSGGTGLSMLSPRVEIGSGGWNSFTSLTNADLTHDAHQDLLAVLNTGIPYVYPVTATGTVQPRTQLQQVGA